VTKVGKHKKLIKPLVGPITSSRPITDPRENKCLLNKSTTTCKSSPYIKSEASIKSAHKNGL